MSEVDCRDNDWSELVESLKARVEELEAVVEKAREFDKWFSKPCSHGGVMLDRKYMKLAARTKELEAVVESARAILTCISDVEDGCVLVSCGDHAADLREALAKLEEPAPSEKDKCEATGCIGCPHCKVDTKRLARELGLQHWEDNEPPRCGTCNKPMQAVRPGKWRCDYEEE